MIELVIGVIWKAFGGISAILLAISFFIFLVAGDSPNKLNAAKNFFIWAVICIILAISMFSVLKVIEITI